MKSIQQQMLEPKRNKRANALKEVKRYRKEFGVIVGMQEGALAKGQGKK